MKKTRDAVKRNLKKDYEKVCNAYLLALSEMWELNVTTYGYWIGEEVGGIFDYDGAFTIGMGDIIFCVEHDVTLHQYMEWQDYVCDASEFNMDMPNLKSWMNGCPRTSVETFKKLRDMKADLAKAVGEEKERIKNTKLNK